uniref:Uncharacterized protein n=1 Tax=Aegilops tauschii TaxID=37682 RepID=M8CTN1_AEGTA
MSLFFLSNKRLPSKHQMHDLRVDAEAVPAVLYRFLADPRVVFVGYGSSYDRRMLWDHYGLDVASACDLRALTGMDGYEVVGRGAVTDEDEEEEDVYDYVARTGLLSDGDYVVGPGIQSDEDEEDGYEGYFLGTGTLNAEDVGEQGYAYKEYAGIGILTVEEGHNEYTGILTVGNEAAAYEDEVFVSNLHATVVEVEVEESGLQLDVYQEPPECYDNSIEAFQVGDDGYGQDDGGDWYDQGDDGYVQDDDSYDAFY